MKIITGDITESLLGCIMGDLPCLFCSEVFSTWYCKRKCKQDTETLCLCE